MTLLVQQQKDGWDFAIGRTIVSPDGSKISKSALLRAIERGDAVTAEKFAVAVAERVDAPEGKRPVGEERLEVVDGKPVLVRDFEDVPPPPPPPEPDRRTVEEKLADAAGVTIEELRGWRDADREAATVR